MGRRRRIRQQKWRSKLLGQPWWSWSASIRVCRVLAAVPAISAAVPTVAVAAAAVASASPAAASSKCSSSAAESESAAAEFLGQVFLRRVAGRHQLRLEREAGGVGGEE